MKNLKDILTIILLSSSSICIILITIQIMLGGVNVNISGTGRGGKIVLDGDLELGSKLLLKDDEVYMLEDGDYKYHPLIIEN
jgi:hypothetical protein